VCIGVFEAFLQAGPLYLTFYYTRKQLATRGAIFFSMMAVAGSMNGVIAYAIQRNLNHAHGWLAWRWLFLIEGKLHQRAHTEQQPSHLTLELLVTLYNPKHVLYKNYI
jgi:MFS family permease